MHKQRMAARWFVGVTDRARSSSNQALVRRTLSACLIAAALTVVSASAVLAHAEIVRSEPPDGGAVAQAPRTVRVWFSEPVSPQATQARVLDADGHAVPSTGVQVAPSDPTELIVTVPDLADGIYNVAYSALSAADGHATQGHLVFTVGAGAGSRASPRTNGGAVVSPVEALLRGLNFLALAGLAGSIAVAFLLLRPDHVPGGNGPRQPEEDAEIASTLDRARGRVLRLALLSAFVAFVAGAAILAWEASTLALPGGNGEIAGRSSAAGLAWLALQTRPGLLLLTRAALLLAIAALLLIRQRRTRPDALASSAGHPARAGAGFVPAPPTPALPTLGVATLAVLVLQALSGHAAAPRPVAVLAVVMDSAHLAAASLWVGGLLALAAGLLPFLLSRPRTAGRAVLARAGWAPFGALAAPSVAVLVATGIYSAGREVASPDALLTTFYGRTLLVKMALVLLAGAFGLLNSTMLHPRLSAPLARLFHRYEAGWTPLSLKHLPTLVLAELAAGGLVLLATGTLVSSPPANGPEFAPPAPLPPPVSAPSQMADDLLVTFDARPNRPGQNVALMQVVSTRRPAPAEIMRVIVRYTFEGQDIGSVTADAREISPGVYQLAGDQLSLPGPWQVEVVVRRKGLEDSQATFQWTVATPVVSRPFVVSNRPLEPVLTPIAILLSACVGGFGVAAALKNAKTPSWWRQRAGRWPQPRPSK